MSSLAFLVTELQSLASETRRKHPEVREAAEKSLAILRSSPEQATANLASDGPQSDDLLRPVFMGCATKNAKVVAISLGSLQRLIALKAVPHSAVPLITTTMNDCMNQGVDIQLRILQTLVSLITNFPAIHGQLLGDALLLCFKLQESRIAVVSSTAAATLRQLVMFIFDKVVDEDRRADLEAGSLIEVTLPNGSTKSLGPSAQDTFAVFEDLCLLANSERPRFLKLEFLRKTFALELIESVLTNYYDLFRKHTELLLLLQHHLCPLLLKSLSDRPNFPLTLRATRVVFLLLKQFSLELKTEAEVFTMLLIKIIGSEGGNIESTDNSHTQGTRPTWMRVLAMEIMRGLCSDAELMRNIWDRYDAEGSGSKVFISLIAALKRLVTEKPAMLGVCAQMAGVGVYAGSGSEGAYGLDVGGVAGMVASAASATVSGMASMMTSESGLSVQTSAMKIQCIDQLDKADVPPIPESYVYLLGVQCFVSLCEGLAAYTGPLYNSIMIQRPRAAGEPVIRAPPALDLSTLPPDESTTKGIRTVRDMIENGWPALLAALSFIISTNLSDELFVDVLSSYQALATVSGMLGLSTPRDAFFTSLAKLAIPARVVSSLDTPASAYAEPNTPSSAVTAFSENLGLSIPGVSAAQPPGLSERNLACLKVLISSALFLAGSLGEGWFDVLEALQNADHLLTLRAARPFVVKRVVSGQGSVSSPSNRTSSLPSGTGGALQNAPSSGPRHPLLADLEPESMQHAIQRVFDTSKNLDDNAFRHFIEALCKLSAAMIKMQSEASGSAASASDSFDEIQHSLSTPSEPAHRRRVSGIQSSKVLVRSGDFGVSKLGSVATLNIHRLIYRSPEVAWNPITQHLLSVIRDAQAPSNIRIQAASILDDILTIVPRNISTTGDMQPQVQQRVLEVLAQQVIPSETTASGSTNIELRRMGYDTLHQILQSSGHTLVVGWEIIFEMLSSVCKPTGAVLSVISEEVASPTTSEPQRSQFNLAGPPSEKGYASLVKIAFQSLTLVCDSLSSLSSEHLRLCISTLGQFGRQADTNIALTAAESLLWGVSDSIQAKRKDVEKEPEYSGLWMYLLLEVLGLCTDARPEVRVGAIQTLFRTLQLYGATLSLVTWDECIWKVTFPLLDSITTAIRNTTAEDPSSQQLLQWNESKILALQSIGSIFNDFLTTKIMLLESFEKAWDVFVGHVQDSWVNDSRTISAAALRCLEKAIKACANAPEDAHERAVQALERVWQACDEMGGAVLAKGPKTPVASPGSGAARIAPFTQDSMLAYVDVVRSTRSVARKFQDSEWVIDRLTRLMVVLKGILTYSESPDFRPDTDVLGPVQAIIMETVDSIDLTVPGAASLVLRDLSEYVTLPFIAAFDVQNKRVTYIALSKKAMPILVDLYLKFKEQADIYADGTLETIFSAYGIPMKLKYECPSPSKYNKDPPLWKTATTNFLRIVKECGKQMRALSEHIPSDRVEGIWRQVVETFRGGILADCSAALNLPLNLQQEDENFDLALVAALEIDVVPYLGERNIPDYVVSQLAKVLQQGSKLRDTESYIPPSPPLSDGKPATHSSRDATRPDSSLSSEFEKLDKFGETDVGLGTTETGRFLPRERFAYWCFDLLFLICSDTAKDQIPARRRVAVLSLAPLLERCRMTLIEFVADEALRGNLPFPRVREEELLYVLQKLHTLRLWPGTLWAALSPSPSVFCLEQPPVDPSLTPAQLIADTIKRSSIAHLFHFYPIFCEIVSILRKTPTAWVMTKARRTSADFTANSEDVRKSISWTQVASGAAQEGRAVELDARLLVKECLKDVGREMGVGR